MQDSDVITEELKDLAVCTKRYCDFIESLGDNPQANLYTILEELLSEVQTAVLPIQKQASSKEFKTHRLDKSQYKEVTKNISRATSARSDELYASFASERKGDDDWISKSNMVRVDMFFDDLADIYHDLKNGLILWDIHTPEAIDAASWEWRFGYENHWGQHLFDAMRTIHEIRYRLHTGG